MLAGDALNDLHQAAGGAENHKPSRFTRTESFTALVEALRPEMASDPAFKPFLACAQAQQAQVAINGIALASSGALCYSARTGLDAR